jgi:hypothetical protein
MLVGNNFIGNIFTLRWACNSVRIDFSGTQFAFLAIRQVLFTMAWRRKVFIQKIIETIP